MPRCLTIVMAVVIVSLHQVTAQAEPEDDAHRWRQWAVELRDGDAAARRNAAYSISAFGLEAVETLPALCEALSDPEPSVRIAAAIALSEMDEASKPALEKLVDLLDDQGFAYAEGYVWQAATVALGAIGRDAVQPVLGRLDPDNTQRFVAAATAIHEIGPAAGAAVPAFREYLSHENAIIQRASVYALGGIGAEASVATAELIALLGHPDFHTRYFACRALGGIGPEAKGATGELARLAREGVSSTRRHAARALGRIGPAGGEASTAVLVDLLNDPVQPVRAEAATALGNWTKLPESAIAALEHGMSNRTLGITIESARSHWTLMQQADQVIPVLLAELAADRRPIEAADVLAIIGPAAGSASSALIDALKSPEPEIRLHAARALAKIDTQGISLTALKSLLEDEDPHVYVAAKRAIARIKRARSQ